MLLDTKIACHPEAQPQLAELYRCFGSLYSAETLECSFGCGRTGSMEKVVGFRWATGGRIWVTRKIEQPLVFPFPEADNHLKFLNLKSYCKEADTPIHVQKFKVEDVQDVVLYKSNIFALRLKVATPTWNVGWKMSFLLGARFLASAMLFSGTAPGTPNNQTLTLTLISQMFGETTFFHAMIFPYQLQLKQDFCHFMPEFLEYSWETTQYFSWIPILEHPWRNFLDGGPCDWFIFPHIYHKKIKYLCRTSVKYTSP